MGKKYYVREGRRFKRVFLPDRKGMFFQQNNTFSKERTDESIGLCVESKIENENAVHIVIDLEDKPLKYSYKEIQRKLSWELPRLEELILAYLEFNTILNFRINSWYISSSDDSDGGVGYLYVDYDPGIFSVYDDNPNTVGKVRLVKRIIE